ncbi:class I SAM-dependent DNA methyltransferase [Rhodoferax sp.]|uniref:type I restriction-modification system subunit M n=1 Tax=Rhodoferax sp. TaxID=50421 RepID=UPI002AB88804|nr:class I SAM-dependent DNA methyltransferase [Rhodoferax sp.]MDZ4207557.1 class I SAM-dependent DNA methyltransferase [Rhodoferax sp.]
MNQQALSAFIWSVADLLRGDYRQHDYGKVILPFTVLRRLDCVLEPTKAAVLAELAAKTKQGINPEPFLRRKARVNFFNQSPMDLKKLLGDPDYVALNLTVYIQGFSPEVRDIFERFEFQAQIERLTKAGLLYQVAEKFAQIDLHPDAVSNMQMGLVFEELIRKFAEISNETAGEHFTPREVIRLMVNLIFIEDDDVLSKPGVVRTIYDPTAGTGGMLSVAGEYLAEHNPQARLTVFGQELNPESYAICKADMLIKGQDVANISFGNTLSDDGHTHKKFDYMLANPPFGVEWKKVEKEVRKEHEQQGYNGRFGPGLPRVSDGSMLFLLHLLSKMRPAAEGGSRFGIVLNGSPLFTGGAGSGESEIRRYVLENDLCEAIVGLPTDMFYNTGISTYIWIISNRKPAARKGKVQLIDASGYWQKMRKSLGSKRKELSDAHIDRITQLFGQFVEVEEDGKPISRIFPNQAFGYSTITVERPLRMRYRVTPRVLRALENSISSRMPNLVGDPKAKFIVAMLLSENTEGWSSPDEFLEAVKNASSKLKKPLSASEIRTFLNSCGERDETCAPGRDSKGRLLPDSSLRDTENVPLSDDVQAYFEREVLPHAPDAWIDHEKTKVGYEIPFNRHFYIFKPPRRLAQIDADLKQTTDRILAMIQGLSA